jgi:glucosyl-3-phosphoglycerate phosphatase
VTLYVARHAPTKLNAETPGPEKIRGWGPAGLGDEGRQVAKDAAQTLRGKVSNPLIVTSDLPRAKETADVLGQELQAQVIPASELRTWNVGDITGQPVSSAKPQLDDLQHRKPTKEAPNGESYADFYGRWSKVVGQLQDIAKDHDIIAVVHGRQVYSLPSILRGDGPSNIPTHGAPNPGDILKVNGTQAEYVHKSGATPKVTS